MYVLSASLASISSCSDPALVLLRLVDLEAVIHEALRLGAAVGGSERQGPSTFPTYPYLSITTTLPKNLSSSSPSSLPLSPLALSDPPHHPLLLLHRRRLPHSERSSRHAPDSLYRPTPHEIR